MTSATKRFISSRPLKSGCLPPQTFGNQASGERVFGPMTIEVRTPSSDKMSKIPLPRRSSHAERVSKSSLENSAITRPPGVILIDGAPRARRHEAIGASGENWAEPDRAAREVWAAAARLHYVKKWS